MVRTILLAGVSALCILRPAQAQPDTVQITLREAEEKFVKNNLQLLAAQFNVSAAQAAVTQAGLWNNPSLGLEQNVHNQYTGTWFDIGQDGNSGVQVQQLLLLAGKRGKQVRIAEINAEMAGLDFQNVLRSLRLELRTDFYDLCFLRRTQTFYHESIAMLTRTVGLMENVYRQRAVLLAELLRVKALLFALQNEQLGITSRIISIEGDLRILLGDSTATVHSYDPLLDFAELDAIRPDSLHLSDVIAIAAGNRPDLRKTEAGVRGEEANLSYQKALAVPDITLGGLWSRAGSYIPDYYALTLSVDLPLFNRNQGNIEVSEHTLNADKLVLENNRMRIEQEVRGAYQKAVEVDRLYRSRDQQVPSDYKSLVSGMIANYENRYISVIEFTDFIESYRTSMTQMNQLENDRVDAIESLNYATGTILFKP